MADKDNRTTDSADTPENELSNWTKMPDGIDSWDGYSHTVDGWKNTETDAEVLVYTVEGTGSEDLTEKDWALQHPWDDDIQEHTQYADTHDEAVGIAQEWMDDHPAPAFVY